MKFIYNTDTGIILQEQGACDSVKGLKNGFALSADHAISTLPKNVSEIEDFEIIEAQEQLSISDTNGEMIRVIEDIYNALTVEQKETLSDKVKEKIDNRVSLRLKSRTVRVNEQSGLYHRPDCPFWDDSEIKMSEFKALGSNYQCGNCCKETK